MNKPNSSKKIYCIDIDGTICTDTQGRYEEAEAFINKIELVNRLYKEGNTIILFTARGSTTKIDWLKITKQQLKKWGVKYHKLIFGKPYADFFVDDKGLDLFRWDRFSLRNKIAIITGSGGGIGEVIVRGLKDASAKVYCIDIKNGFDITNFSSMKKLIKDIYLREKRIDILINCAGITLSGNFEIYNEKKWDKTMLINLKAPFKLSQLVVPYMKKKGGVIINITSLWSERGFANNPAYGASKGGLKQLTKCLAQDLAKYNIRVNNIGFGYIKTNMTKKSWRSRRRLIASKTMLHRWGMPEDVVGAIIFFASDAARYITGQDLYIDGGWLAKGL